VTACACPACVARVRSLTVCALLFTTFVCNIAILLYLYIYYMIYKIYINIKILYMYIYIYTVSNFANFHAPQFVFRPESNRSTLLERSATNAHRRGAQRPYGPRKREATEQTIWAASWPLKARQLEMPAAAQTAAPRLAHPGSSRSARAASACTHGWR